MNANFTTAKAEAQHQPNWGDLFYIGSLISAAEAGDKQAEEELAKMGYVFGRDY